MKLFITTYIENLLKRAEYEYDKETKSWCASVKELPGAYAQSDTVEKVREQLAEVIEDYILISLQEKHPLPGFKKLHIKKIHVLALASSSKGINKEVEEPRFCWSFSSY